MVGQTSLWRRKCPRPQATGFVFGCFGLLLVLVGTVTPRWRVDSQGYRNWRLMSSKNGDRVFNSRQVGLFYVIGRNTNTLEAQKNKICKAKSRNNVSRPSLDWSPVTAINTRCEEHKKLVIWGWICLATSATGIVGGAIGLVAWVVQCRLAVWAFTLLLISAMVLLTTSTVYVILSDDIFKAMMANQWYPYHTIGLSYWFHLWGSSLLLAASLHLAYWNFGSKERETSTEPPKLEHRPSVLWMRPPQAVVEEQHVPDQDAPVEEEFGVQNQYGFPDEEGGSFWDGKDEEGGSFSDGKEESRSSCVDIFAPRKFQRSSGVKIFTPRKFQRRSQEQQDSESPQNLPPLPAGPPSPPLKVFIPRRSFKNLPLAQPAPDIWVPRNFPK